MSKMRLSYRYPEYIIIYIALESTLVCLNWLDLFKEKSCPNLEYYEI